MKINQKVSILRHVDKVSIFYKEELKYFTVNLTGNGEEII